MKNFILISILLMPLLSPAQQIMQYKATNGITYHLNDTVKLGRGSAGDGSFLYLEDRGIVAPGHSHNLPRQFTNGVVVIKKITKDGRGGVNKYLFVVSTRLPFNFSLLIDDAILACEVVPCQSTATNRSTSVADELKKLKQLLDSGALTQAEFDAQKKKLLNQ